MENYVKGSDSCASPSRGSRGDFSPGSKTDIAQVTTDRSTAVNSSSEMSLLESKSDCGPDRDDGGTQDALTKESHETARRRDTKTQDLINDVNLFKKKYRTPSFSGSIDAEMPIEKIARYYLQEDHTAEQGYNWKHKGIIFIISIFSLFTYVKLQKSLAEIYAKDIRIPYLGEFFSLYSAGATCSIFLLSIMTFFSKHHRRKIPECLNSLLVPTYSDKEWRKENLMILLLSGLSASSMASILFSQSRPEGNKIYLLSDLVAVVGIFLSSLLPSKLIVTEKIFHFPVFFINRSLHIAKVFLNNCSFLQRDRSEDLKKQITEDQNKIKKILFSRFFNAINNISYCSFLFSCRELCYHTIPLYMMRSDSDVLKTLENVFSYSDQGINRCNLPGTVNVMLRGLVGVFGSVWPTASILGYYFLLYNMFQEQSRHFFLYRIMAVFPIYQLFVLFSFFGKKFSEDIYDYLIVCETGASKIPVTAKLYPKIFLFVVLINIFGILFSSAAPVEIYLSQVPKNYPKTLSVFLEIAAYTGVPILSFFCIQTLWSSFVWKCAQYCSDHETKRMITFINQLNQFVVALNDMEGELLEDELSQIPLKRRELMLGSSGSKQFSKLIRHGKNLRKEKGKGLLGDVFFCYRRKRVKSDLLGLSTYPSYHHPPESP